MIGLGPNLYDRTTADRNGERTEPLAAGPGVHLERIVSFGHCSPQGFWYDQAETEWVALLTGRARIRIEGRADDIALGPGDTPLLPAHCRPRVEWTDPNEPTIWLALFSTSDPMPT